MKLLHIAVLLSFIDITQCMELNIEHQAKSVVEYLKIQQQNLTDNYDVIASSADSLTALQLLGSGHVDTKRLLYFVRAPRNPVNNNETDEEFYLQNKQAWISIIKKHDTQQALALLSNGQGSYRQAMANYYATTLTYQELLDRDLIITMYHLTNLTCVEFIVMVLANHHQHELQRKTTQPDTKLILQGLQKQVVILELARLNQQEINAYFGEQLEIKKAENMQLKEDTSQLFSRLSGLFEDLSQNKPMVPLQE